MDVLNFLKGGFVLFQKGLFFCLEGINCFQLFFSDKKNVVFFPEGFGFVLCQRNSNCYYQRVFSIAVVFFEGLIFCFRKIFQSSDFLKWV